MVRGRGPIPGHFAARVRGLGRCPETDYTAGRGVAKIGTHFWVFLLCGWSEVFWISREMFACAESAAGTERPAAISVTQWLTADATGRYAYTPKSIGRMCGGRLWGGGAGPRRSPGVGVGGGQALCWVGGA